MGGLHLLSSSHFRGNARKTNTKPITYVWRLDYVVIFPMGWRQQRDLKTDDNQQHKISSILADDRECTKHLATMLLSFAGDAGWWILGLFSTEVHAIRG